MWLTLLASIGLALIGVLCLRSARDSWRTHIPFWHDRAKLCDPNPWFSRKVEYGPGIFAKGHHGAKLAELVSGSDELRDLYALIGYSHNAHRFVLEIIDSLRKLPLTVEFLDLARFRAGLPSVLDRCHKALEKHGKSKGEMWTGLVSFVEQLLEAGDDAEQIGAILMAKSWYRDEIPKWFRVEFQDPLEARQLLAELEECFARRCPRLHPGHRNRSLESAGSFRKALDEAGPVDIQRELESLSMSLESEWENNERRNELDGLLLDLIRAERDRSPDISDISSAAKVYLDSSWMHLRFLTNYIGILLVGALVDPFDRRVNAAQMRLGMWIGFACLLAALALWPSVGFMWIVATIGLIALIDQFQNIGDHRKLCNLWALYEEVSSGNYDAEEIVRRLRTAQDNGVNVPSIAYPLFRLSTSSSQIEG